MTHAKSKNKKPGTKLEKNHEVPFSKTAKGRRPHSEAVNEPYQPSLLEEELEAPVEMGASFDEAASSEEVLETQSSNETHEEVILEGAPAPKAKRTKVDIADHIESVKGVVQMGTTLVKSSFPKPFEIAEKVVEDWKQDGDFSELPISQPLVQFYIGLGLRKAKQTEKDLEKKLESSGVLPVVRQQLQKAQKFFK